LTKVIHILSDTNIGGAGRVLLNCLKHFDKSKFLIKIVLPKNSLLKPEIEKLGYEVIETLHGADKSLDFKAIPEFMRIFKHEKPDIIHAHSSLSARIAAKRCRVQTRVFTKHCVTGVGKLYGILGNFLSSHIIAVDPVSKEILLNAGIKSKKITLIPNGVDPVRKLTEEEKVTTRREFNIMENDLVFGICGRLESIKGHKHFIDAAKIVSEKYDNCKFLIVGTGNKEDALKQQAADLNLSDKIIFAGFLSDITAVTNIMDVAVNTSDSEASSLAIIEAMSLAKPVIATSGGGNWYLVKNNENGLLVPIRDSNAVASAMETLMTDQELRNKMAKNSQEHYTKKFTAQVMARQVEDIYTKE